MFGEVAADPADFRELEEAWADRGEIYHRYLTCRNHPTARYLTKNPWVRGLHFIAAPAEAVDPAWRDEHGSGPGNLECRCPFSDLVVIGQDG